MESMNLKVDTRYEVSTNSGRRTTAYGVDILMQGIRPQLVTFFITYDSSPFCSVTDV